MYVCICNAINDRDIRAAIDGGKRSVRQLHSHFGIEKTCGRCNQCMRRLLDDNAPQKCPNQ